MKVSILVIARRVGTSLGIIRSLGSAGYHVESFMIVRKKGDSKTIAASKYVDKNFEYVGQKNEEVADLLCDLYAKREGDWVLFPADDYCTSLIDHYRERLEKYFRMPNIVGETGDAITKRMDKAFQGRIAKECGLEMPKEWMISLADKEPIIPNDLVFPCFVKPLLSIGGKKIELGVCRNKEELRNKLIAMQKSDKERMVLIQDYLNIDQEYAMSGVCADQTIILPAVVKKKRIAQYLRGVTMMGELVSVEEIGYAKDAVYRFLKKMHYVGMFDLEIMRVGDIFFFGEMNFRSGGPHYSYFASGVNLPVAAVQAIYTGNPDPLPEIQLHKVFLNESEAWNDYQHNYINRKELRQLYRQADILLIGSKDDPVPEKFFLRKARFTKVKIMIAKILRR